MSFDKALCCKLGTALDEFAVDWIKANAPGGRIDGVNVISIHMTKLATVLAQYESPEQRVWLFQHILLALLEHGNVPAMVSVYDASKGADQALLQVEPAGRA